MTPYQVRQYLTTRGQYRGLYMYFLIRLSIPDHLNDQLTTIWYVAAPKIILHRILQALNYDLSQEPEFSRNF